MTSLFAGLFIGALCGLVIAFLYSRGKRRRTLGRLRTGTQDGASDPTKRALLAGLVGGAVGTAGLSATKATKAFADISFGELVRGVREGATDALNSVLGGLIELIFQIVSIVQFPTPGRIMRLINELLGLLESNDSTYIGSDPEGALERSYPTVPVITPEEQAAAVMQREIDTRARVAQAERINGQVAQVQGELTMEEQAIVAMVEGAGPWGLTVVLQAILHMLGNTNMRLGQVSTQLAALSQLQADLVMRPASEREQSQLAKDAHIAGAGETIAPPIEHPAQ